MPEQLIVQRAHLSDARIVTTPGTALADGQIRVRIERFALTSNNITYGAFGDAMNYWDFFPTGDAATGIVPVWGFGTVAQSLNPGVAVGERLWGYWPMADQAVLTPQRLTPQGFSDGAAHRASLHAVYNQYNRCNADPFHTADTEDAQALLRPLFITSWLIDDFLADNAWFGASAVLLSSASSKTAYGCAFQMAQRQDQAAVRRIGLTSPANRAFCESLGCYSEVLTYDELHRIDAATPLVYVDFAGNAALRRDIHTRFTALAHSSSIGGTHVDQLGGARDLPGPRPTLFFAPAQVKKRAGEWGAAQLNERLVHAWHAFVAQACNPASPWLQVRQHRGAGAVLAAYALVLGGRGDPREGHMLGFGA